MSHAPLSLTQGNWLQTLHEVYTEVAATRMAGLPVVHPGLRVEVLGFGTWRVAEARGMLGVLLTPWCMNLVWREDAAATQSGSDAVDWPVGASRPLQIAGQTLSFIGQHDARLGGFACCSLISPMFQFADQAAAHATALAVMAELAAAKEAARAAEQASARATDGASVNPADLPAHGGRRRFLLGGRPPQATAP